MNFKIFFNKSEKNQANKIHKLLKMAKLKDKDLEVFGASSHKYLLNPTTNIEKIREFEKKHNILLPEDYTYFLTQVGNGGAGPQYGLYPLEKLESKNDFTNISKYPALINPDLDIATWNEIIKELDESDDDYDQIARKISAQALVIGTKGCTLDILLMIDGSEKGKIAVIDWDFPKNQPPYLTKKGFIEWYVGFFEIVASGDYKKLYSEYR